VGEHEAGQRLFQVIHDPRCAKSGVYWSWNGGPREGRGAAALEKGGQISGGGGAGGGWDSIFENDQSAKVLDITTQMKLFDYATQITKAEWPDIKAVTSPCPTLKVISAVTKNMVQKEELKRMREMGRPGMNADGTTAAVAVVPYTQSVTSIPSQVQTSVLVTPKKSSIRRKAALLTDTVVSGILSNTVGRVGRIVGKRVLGEIPALAYDENLTVDPTLLLESTSLLPEAAQYMQLDGVENNDPAGLEQAIKQYLAEERVTGQSSIQGRTILDVEDEALFQQITSKSKAAMEKEALV
jgi:hypothetical protein